MPKASSLAGVKKARHTPLHVELNEDAELSKFGRISSKAVKKQQQRDKRASADGGRDGLDGGLRGGRAAASGIDGDVAQGRVETARMSRKILDLARKQQDEIAEEETRGRGMDDDDEDAAVMRITGAVPRKEDSKSTRQAMDDDEEDEDSDFPDEEVEEEEYAELVSLSASCHVNKHVQTHSPCDIRKLTPRIMKLLLHSAAIPTCFLPNSIKISPPYLPRANSHPTPQTCWTA